MRYKHNLSRGQFVINVATEVYYTDWSGRSARRRRSLGGARWRRRILDVVDFTWIKPLIPRWMTHPTRDLCYINMYRSSTSIRGAGIAPMGTVGSTLLRITTQKLSELFSILLNLVNEAYGSIHEENIYLNFIFRERSELNVILIVIAFALNIIKLQQHFL